MNQRHPWEKNSSRLAMCSCDAGDMLTRGDAPVIGTFEFQCLRQEHHLGYPKVNRHDDTRRSVGDAGKHGNYMWSRRWRFIFSRRSSRPCKPFWRTGSKWHRQRCAWTTPAVHKINIRIVPRVLTCDAVYPTRGFRARSSTLAWVE